MDVHIPPHILTLLSQMPDIQQRIAVTDEMNTYYNGVRSMEGLLTMFSVEDTRSPEDVAYSQQEAVQTAQMLGYKMQEGASTIPDPQAREALQAEIEHLCLETERLNDLMEYGLFTGALPKELADHQEIYA